MVTRIVMAIGEYYGVRQARLECVCGTVSYLSLTRDGSKCPTCGREWQIREERVAYLKHGETEDDKDSK